MVGNRLHYGDNLDILRHHITPPLKHLNETFKKAPKSKTETIEALTFDSLGRANDHRH